MELAKQNKNSEKKESLNSNQISIKYIIFENIEQLSDPEFFKKHNIGKRQVINIQMHSGNFQIGKLFYFDK